MSVIGVFLVRMRGYRTRKTPHTDTFCAVITAQKMKIVKLALKSQRLLTDKEFPRTVTSRQQIHVGKITTNCMA